MTGALTDELLSLEKVLLNQRKLMSGDPFDKSMSGMVALQNQYSELKEAVRQYNTGTELSRQQTRELSRDKERIIEKMKMEGKSFTDIKDAIRSYNKEYINAADSVNSLIKVEKDIERAHRDSMNAVRNLTKEEERMTSVVANLSAAQNNGAAMLRINITGSLSAKNVDTNTYKFTNIYTNEIYIGYRYKFVEYTGVNRNNLSSVINGSRKHVNGWTFTGVI